MIQVREATHTDVQQLLALMRDLAAFEDYLDAFDVKEADIEACGFGADRLFTALVAESAGRIVGMAITYIVPWTYTRRPTLVLKELYVAPEERGSGAGSALMAAVAAEARKNGCGQISWTVMAGNIAAEQFYLFVGGTPDVKWNNWLLKL